MFLTAVFLILSVMWDPLTISHMDNLKQVEGCKLNDINKALTMQITILYVHTMGSKSIDLPCPYSK